MVVVFLITLVSVLYMLFAPESREERSKQPTTKVTKAPKRGLEHKAEIKYPTPTPESTPAEPESSKPETVAPATPAQTPKSIFNITIPPQNQMIKGELAIIIDDMGNSMQEVRTLAEIGVPLTLAIIPGLHNDQDVASFAAANGFGVMIHAPMEPKGWPTKRLESNGLLVSMSDNDITERLQAFIREIPQASGLNNHMGSEFTEHEEQMKVVINMLKEKGLFFIDSATTSKSTGLRLAREAGLKSARRTVFLDNEQNIAYIGKQLALAVKAAKKNGYAIAICHPHPATINALRQLLPTLAGKGIKLVLVSKMVR